jgi:hypothetical protein
MGYSISEHEQIRRDNLRIKTKQLNDRLKAIIKDNDINYILMLPAYKPCLTVNDAINKDNCFYAYISNTKLNSILDQLVNKESFVNVSALKTFIKNNHGRRL